MRSRYFSPVEVFDKIKEAKSKKEKKEILASYKNEKSFITLLRLLYDKRFEFDLPEGTPSVMFDSTKKETVPFEYVFYEKGDSPVSLNKSIRKWRVFLKHTNIPRRKKEMMFMEFIRDLHKPEAELFVAVKDRTLELGLTKKDINSVIEGLLP